MKKAIIFGNGNFAVMLKKELELAGVKIEAFTVDERYITDASVDNTKVVPFETLGENYPPEEYELYVAVGYKKMGNIRETVFKKIWEKGYNTPNFIHESVHIGPDFSIGKGNIVFQGVSFGYKTTMGDGNLIFDSTTIAHNNVIGDFNTFSIDVSICGFSVIENHCFIGAGGIVRDSIKIAEYTLMGAGAFALKDTKPYQTFAAPKAQLLSKTSLEIEEML